MEKKTALLIVDVQVGMFTVPNDPLYQGEELLDTLERLASYWVTSLPENIGDLKSLRILNLERNLLRSLPESIYQAQNRDQLLSTHFFQFTLQ